MEIFNLIVEITTIIYKMDLLKLQKIEVGEKDK